VRGAAVEADRAAVTGAAGLASTAASTLIKSTRPSKQQTYVVVTSVEIVKVGGLRPGEVER
jgi:hypothetical protein